MIYNAFESRKSAFSNLKNGNIKSFDMNFRSRKQKSQIIYADYRSLKLVEKVTKMKNKRNKNTKKSVKTKKEKEIHIFVNSPLWKNCSKLMIKSNKDREWLIDQFNMGPEYYDRMEKKKLYKKFIPSNFTIKYESPNKYFLCIPSFRTEEYIKPKYEIVSLDPGVRTFLTFYSPEGITGKIGNGIIDKLIKIGKRVDKMIGHASKEETVRLKKRINMRCDLLRTKMRNIVKDLHHKAADYLTKNFRTIILPTFDVSKMVIIGKRNISSKTVREMLSLSHGKFREILRGKAEERDRTLHLCDESYTSKTCGSCGNIDKDLGGSKVYKCTNKRCKKRGKKIDRDIHGARNILLKQLSKL